MSSCYTCEGKNEMKRESEKTQTNDGVTARSSANSNFCTHAHNASSNEKAMEVFFLRANKRSSEGRKKTLKVIYKNHGDCRERGAKEQKLTICHRPGICKSVSAFRPLTRLLAVTLVRPMVLIFPHLLLLFELFGCLHFLTNPFFLFAGLIFFS
jgi:hypothetical protein